MKHVPLSQAKQRQNGPNCTVLDYERSAISDMAVAEINGRYPEQNYIVNGGSEEALYVISGKGKIVTKTGSAELNEGDVLYLAVDEPYYYEGEKLRLAISCAPPFMHEALKEVE